jgi:nitrile hydratase
VSEHKHDHEPQAIRAQALESLLIEKGLLTADAIDDVITQYSERVGPLNGARVVARAWTNPEFKQQLLTDGTSAIESFGFEGGQVEKLVVIENTDEVHNAVVCTLCSCYPWAVLGLPPRWYKDPQYRSRIVREPRVVLKEMGLDLPDEVEIRIWDSSAEVRYMILPQQPHHSIGKSEEELIDVVTRDSMIGVALL